MTTIKDIAKAAGVSVTTVSNVIHGNAGRVSPATIEKIQQIMKEMHYIPNMGARLLVRNQSKIIGVIIHGYREAKDGTFHSPFTAEIIGAMEREIRLNGYYMMLYASDSPEEIKNLVANWNVDGIITVGLGMDFCDLLKEWLQIPVVFTMKNSMSMLEPRMKKEDIWQQNIFWSMATAALDLQRNIGLQKGKPIDVRMDFVCMGFAGRAWRKGLCGVSRWSYLEKI